MFVYSKNTISVFPRDVLATVNAKRMLSILVVNNFLSFAGMMQTLLICGKVHNPKSTDEDRAVRINFLIS